MDEFKKQIRRQLRKIISEIPDGARADKSRKICNLVIQSEPFKKASIVMVFLSLPSEVDTSPIILNAWQYGKTVAVPKISWQPKFLTPVEITSLQTGLSTDKLGLRTPINTNLVPISDIDLVLAPGLGFDKHCNRLGRGGSFYDHFLAQPAIQAQKWALAFTEQILDLIPFDAQDVAMDAIVTDNGIIYKNL